ncbi:MAG: carbon-nitrogen hydrolase family protein [Candidatus Zixiibacteriota bacterium]|nr:MAG: carbon-nitrogen hydrolase family protein [candidate division Zixibacteria bacterium]
MLIKVVAVQARLGEPLSLADKLRIFRQRPDFVCLPEYFQLDGTIDDFHRAALYRTAHEEYLASLSDELSTCLIGGTVVEADGQQLYNSACLFNRGELVGRYRKRYPVPGERARGITAGDETAVFEIDGVRVGLMICGDVFHPELYRELGDHQVDIIMVPTTSPYRPDDSIARKHHRDRIYFLEGALHSGAYVIKTCGVGALFGKPLQGRSLIASPWEIIRRVPVTQEHLPQMLTATLDITEIREFRRRYRREVAVSVDVPR